MPVVVHFLDHKTARRAVAVTAGRPIRLSEARGLPSSSQMGS